VRRASTVIRISCLMVPLVFAWGCAASSGSASGSKPAPLDKADQALATAQSALQEAKAARAAAEAALQEARGNRAKLDQLVAAMKTSNSGDAVQALDAARAANQAAQEAKLIAQQAQQSADKLTTRQDRMFEKGQRK
jgi:hypothetical protein